MPVWPSGTAQATDTVAYLPEGLFTADANTDGLSDGWTAALTGTVVPTYTRTTEAGIPCTIQKITVPSTSGATQVKLTKQVNVAQTTDYAPGDIIRFSCLVRITDTDPAAGQAIAGAISNMQFSFTLGASDMFSRISTDRTAAGQVSGLGWMTLDVYFTARATDASWTAGLILSTANGSGATGGAGSVEFAAASYTNVTRVGAT